MIGAKKSWRDRGNSYIVTINGRYELDTMYETLKAEIESGKEEIGVTFAKKYGTGGMLIPVKEIVEYGKI